MSRTISLLCLLLLAAAAPAGAQNVIRVGQTVTGELTESDPTDEEGAHYDVYRFTAEADEWYSITLESREFDAYLRVGSRPPECDDCQEDDDGGGGLDAQVLYHAREAGRYVIHASSLGPDAGRYTLRLESAVMDTTIVSADTVAWMDSVVTWTDTLSPPVVVPYTDTVVWPDTLAWTDTVAYMPMDSAAAGGDVLMVGVALYGELGPGDAEGEDGIAYDDWSYEGRAGETIILDMEADDFDALLMLGRTGGGAWEPLRRDDDSGEGTNAQILHTFDADGLYTVRATAYLPSAGEYRLTLQSDLAGDPWADLPTTDTVVGPVEPLEYGRTVRGELAAGDQNYAGPNFDVYSFSGREGETVTLTLESDGFDAFLFVAPASTGEKLATDDDGGEGTNARITVTLPETGEYLVRATSFDSGGTGAYTLRLERGPD